MGYHLGMAPSSDGTSNPRAVPALDRDVRSAVPPTPPKSDEPTEVALELAVDPRSLVRGHAEIGGVSRSQSSADLALPDLASDARLLADFGESPRHWILSPIYAVRVLKRVREIKAALAGRRDEAARAADEVEDALVAISERSRPIAETSPEYADDLSVLKQSEEVLRSRDQVRAVEQDAQTARLAQVDARLSSLEAELGQAQRDEQATLAELSLLQEALSREEARLKRAETEVRAAQQRASGTGTVG
jgi:hypothetical protein